MEPGKSPQTFLKKKLEAPIQVISLGCVLVDDPGLLYLDRLYHLYGETEHRSYYPAEHLRSSPSWLGGSHSRPQAKTLPFC